MEKKAQRLVRKTIATAILMLCSFSYAQDNIGKRELIILNKIINDVYKGSTKPVYIREMPSNLADTQINEYYKYRYEGEMRSRIVLGMKDGEMIYDTAENNAKYAKRQFAVLSTLDLYFSQSDLKRGIEQKEKKWKAKDFKEYQILKSGDETNISYQNIYICLLSRPFFSSDKKFMAIYLTTNFSKALYIYKLENGNWVEIQRIQTF